MVEITIVQGCKNPWRWVAQVTSLYGDAWYHFTCLWSESARKQVHRSLQNCWLSVRNFLVWPLWRLVVGGGG